MRKLLFSVGIKDCEVQTFTVGGHGGSGKDTSNTGVRIVHKPSGASGEARESRSQLANKRTAFRRMAISKAFQTWARTKTCQMAGQRSVEELVDDAMHPSNLLVEYWTGNGWSVNGQNQENGD